MPEELPKILSFDIEIANVFDDPPDGDIDQFAPFDISVAATVIHGGEKRLWYSLGDDGKPALHITQDRAHALLEFLAEKQREGYMVCAWNGLSFDLKWIGHAAQDMDLAAKIALEHYDPMFQFFMNRGFPVGLAAVAKGLGIQETKLMDGKDAPQAWADGEYQRVMEYVIGDCKITNRVIAEIIQQKGISWYTKRGRLSTEPMPVLGTVMECLELPMPDQSWMDTPIPREKFMGWLADAK